jgi:hypothetical protein
VAKRLMSPACRVLPPPRQRADGRPLPPSGCPASWPAIGTAAVRNLPHVGCPLRLNRMDGAVKQADSEWRLGNEDYIECDRNLDALDETCPHANKKAHEPLSRRGPPALRRPAAGRR